MLADMGPGTRERTSSNDVIKVEVCGWELYAHVSAGVYISQSGGWSSMYDQSDARIVRLNRSDCPLLCALYVLMKAFLVFKMRQKSPRNLELNSDPLWESSSVGAP